MNKHGDHDASCLCCEHCYVSYTPGYGSMTPSSGPSIECLKSVQMGESLRSEDVKLHGWAAKGARCDKFEGK